ncbi:DUF6266 family protein [Halosquirtibacter xylanolyticus]|uniref:DUF6266 family protein n=1 Tax=Halosquirtibacter xylanolyticus TaxID=3374599 RepID=UPI0037482192|nr:DUF6266 family protein [Prolixibacteraceae bacterium]
MGKIVKGVLGGFMGKVGSVIGSRWKGTYFMRSLPEIIKRKNISLKCLQQRARFKKTADFISDARRLVRIGFRPESQRLTTFNAAYDDNEEHFRYVNDHVEVDFPSLKLTSGRLGQMDNISLTLGDDGLLQIDWSTVDIKEIEGEKCKVNLLICRDDMEYMKCYVGVADVADLGVELMITDSMEGHKLHLYAFYSTSKGLCQDHVSKTAYATITA